MCNASVRKETIACGKFLEDEQFRAAWFAGGRKGRGAEHLWVAIN